MDETSSSSLRDTNISARNPLDSSSPTIIPVASKQQQQQQQQEEALDDVPSSTTTTGPSSHQGRSAANRTSSSHKPSRSSAFLGFAAAALDKTQSALSSTDLGLSRRSSSSVLGRGVSPSDAVFSNTSGSSGNGSVERGLRKRRSINLFANTGAAPPTDSAFFPSEGKASQQQSGSVSPPVHELPSQPYSDTDPTRPPPIIGSHNKNSNMHQTSSRLLRMTDDDRPFTKDFKDLFATLLVSLLPLSAHRVRLTRVENTFLSEDAINNLGSLKFSQSNRMPDPKDPSRIVTTTTTTTFSMAKDMARSICQRFLEARFIESADGKYQQVYSMKGSVWQLTSKGATILDRFCSRNGIQQKQIAEIVGNTTCQLVILERDSQTDKLITDRGTIEVVFRRFVGAHGPNVKSTVASADSESLSDYRDGLTGVKMASERKINGKTFRDTFTGKAAVDWLMDCCTTVDRRETVDIAMLFVQYDLMEPVVQDRAHASQNPNHTLFQPSKNSVYQLTAKGKDIVNGVGARGRASESEGSNPSRNAIARDSNTQRLDKILNDAALRLLFRENLRETHCEENLSFYLEVDDFVRNCKGAIRSSQKNPGGTSMDSIKEIMAQAYAIYNAFLAPGSPCELNIDHQLRNNLATRMTKAVGQDKAMIDALQEVTSLFEDAQNAVFKLMASDSVPKFLRSPKYEHTLKHYDFDAIAPVRPGVERSQSRTKRP